MYIAVGFVVGIFAFLGGILVTREYYRGKITYQREAVDRLVHLNAELKAGCQELFGIPGASTTQARSGKSCHTCIDVTARRRPESCKSCEFFSNWLPSDTDEDDPYDDDTSTEDEDALLMELGDDVLGPYLDERGE